MSTDRRLRELQRQAAQGDPGAAWRLALEQCRVGDRQVAFLDVQRYECGGEANDVARFTHEATDLVFCLIPGGTFLMGIPEGEEGHTKNEGPQHEVQVEPFLLCQTACTQKAWKGVTGANPSSITGSRRPVENVSWNDVQAFCEQAGLRLPSEAEWEYACRAGTTTPFAFGETITPEQVNYDGSYPYGDTPQGLYREETTDVGSFPANAFGLFDVHGNVAEWCQDAWHDTYVGAPAVGWPAWGGGAGASHRIRRGGGWAEDAQDCRSALRNGSKPGSRDSYLGFRPAIAL